MNQLRYKRFVTTYNYNNEDKCYVGHIDNIHDIVGFHGNTIE